MVTRVGGSGEVGLLNFCKRGGCWSWGSDFPRSLVRSSAIIKNSTTSIDVRTSLHGDGNTECVGVVNAGEVFPMRGSNFDTTEEFCLICGLAEGNGGAAYCIFVHDEIVIGVFVVHDISHGAIGDDFDIVLISDASGGFDHIDATAHVGISSRDLIG